MYTVVFMKYCCVYTGCCFRSGFFNFYSEILLSVYSFYSIPMAWAHGASLVKYCCVYTGGFFFIPLAWAQGSVQFSPP